MTGRPISILNGPNLGRFGERQPEIYGLGTLADAERLARQAADEVGLHVARFCQVEGEGDLVTLILGARGAESGIVINPGALSHYSLAVADALAAVDLPVVEVHVSNVYAREDFRARSVVSPVARGVVSGFGIAGYALAVRALAGVLQA